MTIPRQSEQHIGSHALVNGPTKRRLYAERQDVMDRVLGIHLVAQMPSSQVSSELRLQSMRRALREGRWADALVEWMEETGQTVDVYDEAPRVFDLTERVWRDMDVPLHDVQELLSASPLFQVPTEGNRRSNSASKE